MEYYSRISTHRFRRITIRLSIIEIEFRTRALPAREPESNEERAYKRARIEEAMNAQRYSAEMRWALHV
jgi:hypothetical protein